MNALSEHSSSVVKVFVYGTLKPGEVNYQRYCEGKVGAIEPAIAPGNLFALPFGYPAMTQDSINSINSDATPTRWVQGFVLTLAAPQVLADLDRLEGYHPDRAPSENEYERKFIETFDPDECLLGLAWVYLMKLAKIQHFGGVWLPNGCWSRDSSPT